MGSTLRDRWGMTLIGATAAACLYALFKSVESGVLGDRPALTLSVFTATFFGGLLAMAGPIGPKRAAVGAAGIALPTSLLILLVSLRFEPPSELISGPQTALAGLILATLPIPFVIAQAGPGWRDYPSLFLQAWSIVVRYAAAFAFCGLAWLVIFLSDEMLKIVGIRVIGDLIDNEIVPFVLTGAVVGLGMAVVYDYAELLSPFVVLRLLRLMLPVVLGVMLVFLLALPVRGLGGLFNGWSPAMVLLAMVAAGISLVSIAVDQSDAEATSSPFLRLAAQGQALILPVVSAFACWAVWMRVSQYGWTPDRLFVALIAVVALIYGLIYATAVLRRGAWMDRIRAGNLHMALAVIGLAALWLTPVLNAERISARDQFARFEAGLTPVNALDVLAIGRWGTAGDEVLAALAEKAKEPGQEELAARLEDPWAETAMTEDARAALVAELTGLMPLQPTGATGTRETLLGGMTEYDLTRMVESCKRQGKDGRAGCVMVVADLLTLRPGEEAIVVLADSYDFAQVYGLVMNDDGTVGLRNAMLANGRYPDSNQAFSMLRDFQDRTPAVAPAPVNQLGTGETGVFVLP